MRLSSRFLVKSVKEKRDQALAARLSRAAQGAERLGITHVRVRRILRCYLIYPINAYIYTVITLLRYTMIEVAKFGGVRRSPVCGARPWNTLFRK